MKLRAADRFQGFEGKNKFLGGKIFAFILCFKKKCSREKKFGMEQKNCGRHCPRIPPCGHGPDETYIKTHSNNQETI